MKKKLKKSYHLANWFLTSLCKSILNVGKILDQNIINSDDLEKTLILAPHADDEWIGCSQILKNSNDNTVYYFNFLGKNYSKSNEEIRLSELKSLQKEIGFELIVAHHNNDYKDLEKLISENSFSSIFIPFPIDWHPEHILVNKIILEILSKLKTLTPHFYFYKVSVPLPLGVNKKFLPMTKEDTKEKKRMFDLFYPSQKNVSIVRLILQNRLSAGKSKYYAIEPYALLDFFIWQKMLQQIDLKFKEDLEPLSHIIDSPLKIRKASNAVFNNMIKLVNDES